MCAMAFWAENSNFEFSWQTQLLSRLCSVLLDLGGGGRACHVGLRPALAGLSGLHEEERKQKELGYGSSSG